MSVFALKALVNHSTRDVTAGYVQHSAERLRAPAQRVADRLRELCRIEPGIARLSAARLSFSIYCWGSSIYIRP
jgi:hypothetical protein